MNVRLKKVILNVTHKDGEDGGEERVEGEGGDYIVPVGEEKEEEELDELHFCLSYFWKYY